MTHVVDAASIVQTVSAFLYIALGAWVLTLTPRRRQTLLLGAFAILFGLAFAPADLLAVLDIGRPPASDLFYIVKAPFSVLSAIAVVALAAHVPRRLEDHRRLALAVGIGFGIPTAMGVTSQIGTLLQSAGGGVGLVARAAVGIFEAGGPLSAGFLLAFRAGSSEAEPSEAITQLALLAVAVATLNAFVAGMEVPRMAQGLARSAADPLVRSGFRVGSWLLVAGLWIANMARAGDATVRIHRAAALAILGLLTAGAVYQAAFPAVPPTNNVMRGVMRTLGVGLLAYGVLRHDLAGLDAKVEWTVSKTTVAGVFVAVFFIVSEGAQLLFAGFARSELLGIVAAGALLFALAPIQRLADRIAEEVVPTAEAAADADEQRYRTAVEVALADGEISRDEERRLAELADEIGLEATRALEIREAVMGELEPASRGDD